MTTRFWLLNFLPRAQAVFSLGFGAALLLFGIIGVEGAPLVREPNTTLALPQNPPEFGYRTERAFGNLSIPNPLAIATPPGETNRIFVITQNGRVMEIADLTAPSASVFLDLSSRVSSGFENGLLGIAFHPGYATNGFFYLFFTANTSGNDNTLVRFSVMADDPHRADPSSELVLFRQRDDADNHNGGDLHFGPDGYLYVSVGDEGNGDDTLNNSQRITKDLFAGILRIDVDKRPGNLEPASHPAVIVNSGTGLANYSIPSDNPFVGATTFNGVEIDPARVRTEFWAVGLRNPWRMSFDPVTGLLWCGDVGQNAREEVVIITKGGNYGWNYREGTLRGPDASEAPPGFTSIDPIYEYPHTATTFGGVSITGGVVYRGHRLAQLYGKYVFADNFYGGVWAFDSTNRANPAVAHLLTDRDISAFGHDPRNGDVLICDIGEDTIKRLVYNSTPTGSPLPPTLADTGAFSDLATLAVHPGIVPYELNVPFWSDGAAKRRWFSVPNTNDVLGFAPAGNWSFPPGAIWIKHFEIETTNGVPESARRLETRFLVRNTNGVYGVTYRWNAEQTNAELVSEAGLDETLLIQDGGTIRTQVWHYPSRTECSICHTPQGGLVLGFNTPQLNRGTAAGGDVENQLAWLSQAGYLDAPVAVAATHTLPRAVHHSDAAVSLESRVRSYLAANCANCHQPGGAGRGLFDARLGTLLADTGLIDGPLMDDKGHSQNRVITPGSIDRSEMLRRISIRGPGQMPPLASHEVDQDAVALLTAWITEGLNNYENWTGWQTRQFGSPAAPEAAREADPDGDGAVNYLEYLLGRNPKEADSWAVTASQDDEQIEIAYPKVANRGFEVQSTTDLHNPASWTPVNAPGNEPIFSATTITNVVMDSLTNSPAKYYRVRVFEP